MITSEFTDKDGFKLQFDETCTEIDKKFFRDQYPKVDLVANQRLHCTTCDIHIGTAPISEKIIRTHQVLGVTQCNKCFAFYNSGEFGKGEDGSEYYCRWCGQGGEVFCCSSCPFVFCNKCIRSNLTHTYVKEIEETDDWNCFVCDKNILQKHRGQHWALRNFMNKQLEKIQKINVTSEDDLNNLLNEDVSTCCPRRKRKSIVKPVLAPVKRPSMNGGFMAAQPPAKKISLQPQMKPAVKPAVLNTYRPGPAQSKTGPPGKKNNDEIVCTPDIMGLFNDNEDSAIPTTNMMPSTSLAPPPLVMRNNPRPIRPTAPTPTPIYHNVNGFQIDLNHAARQEIFRLPNGKLIQVRKQTGPPAQSGPFRPGMSVAPSPRGPQFTIRQANPTTARNFQPRAAPQIRARFNSQPQTRFTFTDGRVVAQPQASAPATPAPTASTVFTQQNGSISVARAPQPATPFGTAKTEFEDKIISGMEICQHTINKMITLTNSTSFKTSGNFKDLKDLYIHLQYLFTYTSGKFKTLQESLTTGMETLAKHDMNLKDKADDDELEIVEEKQDVIEVMSDDDEPPAPVKEKEKSPAAPVKKPLLKHIQYTKDTPSATDVEQELPASCIEPAKAPVAPGDENSSDSINLAEILEKDKKLKNRVVVKVEKLEDTKNPVIKHYINQLQERQEMQSSDGSREGTPDNLFEPMVMLDEGEGEKEKSPVPVDAAASIVAVEIDEDAESSEKLPEQEAEKEPTSDKPETSADDSVVEVPSDDDDVVETTTDKEVLEPQVILDEPEVMEVDESDGVEKTGEVEKEKEVVAVEESKAEETVEKEPELEKPELEAEKEPKVVETPAEVKTPESAEIDKEANLPTATEEPPASDEQLTQEVPQETQASDEKITENGFVEAAATNGSDVNNDVAMDQIEPLSEKNNDELPTVEEVTKITATDIDDEKAMLDDLLETYVELENNKSAMEVD